MAVWPTATGAAVRSWTRDTTCAAVCGRADLSVVGLEVDGHTLSKRTTGCAWSVRVVPGHSICLSFV